MSDVFLEALRLGFQRFIKLYQDLEEGNKQFLEGKPLPEHLQTLLEQRDFTVEEIRGLENELIRACQEKFPKQSEVGLRDGFQFLEKSGGADLILAETFKKILATLVVSDQRVNEVLATHKKELQEQIRTVRRGATLLKGYALSETMDSVFFDKVKIEALLLL